MKSKLGFFQPFSRSQARTVMANDDAAQKLFAEAMAQMGPILWRMCRAYESSPTGREDLFQEMQLAVWKSLASFEARCSLRTWVYRVVTTTAIDHVRRQKRGGRKDWMQLNEEDPGETALRAGLTMTHGLDTSESNVHLRAALHKLFSALHPLDRQVLLLYLEGEQAAFIGETLGISAGLVATKISRIKRLLAQRASATS